MGARDNLNIAYWVFFGLGWAILIFSGGESPIAAGISFFIAFIIIVMAAIFTDKYD